MSSFCYNPACLGTKKPTTSCKCKTVFYCSAECKTEDHDRHVEICNKSEKKGGFVEVNKSILTTHYSKLVKSSIIGLGRSNQMFWGKIDLSPHIDDTSKKVTYEGGVAVRKVGKNVVISFNGVGRLTAPEHYVHIGEFCDSIFHGHGICHYKNEVSVKGKWKHGKVKIVEQTNNMAPNPLMTIMAESSYYKGYATPMQDSAYYKRCTDYLSYNLRGGGVYEIKKKNTLINTNIRRIEHGLTMESNYFFVTALVWKGDSYDGDDDILKICKQEKVSIVSFISETCPQHGELTPISTMKTGGDLEAILVEFIRGEYVPSEECNCIEAVELPVKVQKVKKIVFEEVVKKVKVVKRCEMSYDTDSCTDSEDEKLPGVRGASKREMSSGDEEYISTGRLYSDLVANKWTLLRNKKHRIYTRIIIKDGKKKNQRFVCAATPSDHRVEKTCMNMLMNLNRGVTKSICLTKIIN